MWLRVRRSLRFDAAPDDGVAQRKTWLYLRMAMIGLVIGLSASIGYEFFHSKHSDIPPSPGHCILGSVSAYYYTPVQAYFVGTLVAIGICLVTLKGSTEWEDVLLNLAGVCAPFVALVPTPNVPKTGTDCWSAIEDVTQTHRKININNNVTAVLVVIAAGLITALCLSRPWKWSDRAERPSPIAVIGYVLMVVGYGLVLWRFFFAGDRDWFLRNAHDYAAIAMFSFIVLNVLFDAVHFYLYRRKRNRKVHRLNRYAVIGLAMIIVALGCWGVGAKTHSHYTVFAIEASLITLFAAFWLVQTVELGGGRRPPPTTAVADDMNAG